MSSHSGREWPATRGEAPAPVYSSSFLETGGMRAEVRST